MSLNFGKIAARVEQWFERNARDLPWRKTKDPYAIWISEVMLQQTQVKTVIPYWERWMPEFPDVERLANAPWERVLKLWEGLGYYSRARNLQKAARRISIEFAGTFPTSFEAVLSLPGIGRYTAGAICSIAFGMPTPILDGNVARVLARVFKVRGSVKDSAVKAKLWSLSNELVQIAKDSSALNQGLMELGAMICTPRLPLCPKCPVRKECAAFRDGAVDAFPEKREAPSMRERCFVALVVYRGSSVLVRKRGSNVVNADLWEFPNFETTDSGINPMEHLQLNFLPLPTIRHTITRNRIELRAFAGQANGKYRALAKDLDCEWKDIAELQQLPFSSAHAKLRAAIQGLHAIRNKA